MLVATGATTLTKLAERVAATPDTAASLTQEQLVLTIATGLHHGFVTIVPGDKPKPHSTKFEVRRATDWGCLLFADHTCDYNDGVPIAILISLTLQQRSFD